MNAIRVVVADDHPMFRSGIKNLLNNSDGITVVGEAGSGPEALEVARKEQPDVLLLDMEMPGCSGVEVASRLDENDSPIRVLALSSHDDNEYTIRLLKSNASGYLTKDNAPDLIVESVRAVADGKVRWFVKPEKQTYQTNPDLTEREREVLSLIARGYSNREVSDILSLSENTVRKHTNKTYQKLGVDSAREAIAWAWQTGILSN